jgi:hypothetical protein
MTKGSAYEESYRFAPTVHQQHLLGASAAPRESEYLDLVAFRVQALGGNNPDGYPLLL